MTRALARTGDPITSHAAADFVTPHLTNLEQKVLQALEDSRYGLTTKQIAEKTGIDRVTVSPRMKPLKNKGLVVRTESRRDGSQVWRAA